LADRDGTAHLSVGSRVQTNAADGETRINQDPNASIDQHPPCQDTKTLPSRIGATKGSVNHDPLYFASTYANVLKYGHRGVFHLEKLPKELREMIWEARMRMDGNFKGSFNVS
jgi:hypothetical protein